ncbi:hypothetical protein U0070_014012, partial [Myodes glareolus]
VYFSNHKGLKNNSSPNDGHAQVALQARNLVHLGSLAMTTKMVMTDQMTLDVLHQVTKFGTVLKTIVFTRNNCFQVLLRYALHMGIQEGEYASVEGRQQPGPAAMSFLQQAQAVSRGPGRPELHRGLTASSPLHCFRKLASKYFKNFLLLSPVSLQHPFLTEGPQDGLIQMDLLEGAVQAPTKPHTHNLGKHHYLQVLQVYHLVA